MALLQVEAARLSLGQLEKGVIQEIVTADELFAFLPFLSIDGVQYRYTRESTLPAVAAVAVNGNIAQSEATFTSVTANLIRLIGDYDVDKFLDTVYSDIQSQIAVQTQLKAKAMARAYSNYLINGNVALNANTFNGFLATVTAAQTIYPTGANGGAISFPLLDQLIDLVQIPMGRCDALVMPSRTIQSYLTLVRNASGGIDPAMFALPNFGNGKKYPHYRDIPILRNDWIPTNRTRGSGNTCTAVFAVAFGEIDGVTGLTAKKNGGIQYETVGTVQNRDAVRNRLKWYCGMAMKSTRSLAMLDGVTN